ncbi:MAG: hypothetical protein VX837_03250, partial [Candidatus Thermoplasmatota archaeon]|nr:hypothetical protein [Candidatus Thermoplasmatota archaeon]
MVSGCGEYDAQPRSRSGFFLAADEQFESGYAAYTCLSPLACPSVGYEAFNTCPEGSSGITCSMCERGWSWGGGSC